MGESHRSPQGFDTYGTRMTIMVTIVTCALLASAFVNPATVSSSSQHLLNDNYADVEEGAYDYVYADTDLLLQKRGGYCMSYGRGCSTKGIPCCDSHICRCNVFGGNCKVAFFLLRHVWLEHASRREKSVTN